jgi:multidrug resistance efflux pump
MKNINFQRGKSAIRTWEQDQRTKVPINWDRLIYIVILVVALFFFFRYLYNRLMYIHADGQVLFERVNIMNTDDSRILNFHVAEGDEVKVGDSLFTYFEDEDAFGRFTSSGGSSASMLRNNDPEWIEREIYNLQRQIAGNDIRLKEARAELELQESQVERIRNEVILDILPHSKLQEVENRISSLKFDIERIESEMMVSKRFLGQLYGMRGTGKPDKASVTAGGNGAGGDDQGKKVFFSPLEGTITKINFQPFEVALKSEVIMSIHQPQDIFIKGFFEQEDINELREGDQLEVLFPDGTKSVGFIRRFYFATNTLPEEFQKKYEPTTRSLVADIYPLNETELSKWKAFYKMSVRLVKSKY